ncbi:hypothetical protein [Aeromicrobium duanguangcaii]|uniref:Uncharacterized protein n=1 Tax=Aeromicrobium duanguangcaii TaxID=2968086 RepID=A0ABY5KHH3_9ACTN|nr:hypothetical protein [Aeromicrobium duanguangcaii]MCD9152983.1 hypothetical protein [Aeromicrobium duanguangcaii]UUI69912.1 hypothetical protein NP095_07405 [Aeromicrobium duanguangcaii]
MSALRTMTSLAVGALAVAAGGFGVARAGASPASPPPSIAEIADHVRAMGGDSFAGLEVDPDKKVITARWHGSVPAKVAEYAAETPEGIRIVATSQAAYTRAELQVVARKLAGSAEGRALGLTEVSVHSDGSGVRAGVTADVPSQDEQRELARFAGLPPSAITYEADVNLVNLPATRIDQD